MNATNLVKTINLQKKKKKNFDRFGGDIFWLLYNKNDINDKSCECD